MPDKQSNLLLWLVVGCATLLLLIVSLVSLSLYFSKDGSPLFAISSNQVAVLHLEGAIFDSKDFIEQLKAYGNRSGVRAVVLRLNTPGGGVAASQEIYEAVKRFRTETRKKVVVSMASVAASGGYYIACAADKIIANPGSVTGSIGVIVEWLNFGELLKWAKTEDIIIKSGPLKDVGSPTRPLTDAERAYLQSIVDNMHKQFVSVVAASRKMDEAAVRKLADGRVFTGEEAKSNGLIDEIGTLQDAVAAAAKMSGIAGEPRTITPPKRKIALLDLLLGDSRSLLKVTTDRSESHIRFQYLWR